VAATRRTTQILSRHETYDATFLEHDQVVQMRRVHAVPCGRRALVGSRRRELAVEKLSNFHDAGQFTSRPLRHLSPARIGYERDDRCEVLGQQTEEVVDGEDPRQLTDVVDHRHPPDPHALHL